VAESSFWIGLAAAVLFLLVFIVGVLWQIAREVARLRVAVDATTEAVNEQSRDLFGLLDERLDWMTRTLCEASREQTRDLLPEVSDG
jgi:hypothetical protein